MKGAIQTNGGGNSLRRAVTAGVVATVLSITGIFASETPSIYGGEGAASFFALYVHTKHDIIPVMKIRIDLRVDTIMQ